MEQKKRRFPWRAARRERRLLTALATVLCGEIFFSIGIENFRISGAVVLFPVLLMTLVQDDRTPITGAMTGICLLVVRSALDVLGGGETWLEAVLLNYPAAVFYPCYDALLCLLVGNRFFLFLAGLIPRGAGQIILLVVYILLGLDLLASFAALLQWKGRLA